MLCTSLNRKMVKNNDRRKQEKDKQKVPELKLGVGETRKWNQEVAKGASTALAILNQGAQLTGVCTPIIY